MPIERQTNGDFPDNYLREVEIYSGFSVDDWTKRIQYWRYIRGICLVSYEFLSMIYKLPDEALSKLEEALGEKPSDLNSME